MAYTVPKQGHAVDLEVAHDDHAVDKHTDSHRAAAGNVAGSVVAYLDGEDIVLDLVDIACDEAWVGHGDAEDKMGHF